MGVSANPPRTPKAGSFFVYIVRCRDGTLYTGYTVDIQKRVATHNMGRGAKYTRSRLPVTLVFRRRLRSTGEALRAEAFIKQLNRADKEQLIRDPRRWKALMRVEGRNDQ